jgi:inner membrane protein
MMGRTHATIGAAAGLAVALAYGQPVQNGIALAVIGALTALVPDVDHPQSVIRQRAGIAGWVLFGYLKHRGFTHTFWAWGGLALAGYLWHFPAPALATVALAYGSHIVADVMTRGGLPLLYPFTTRMFHLPPNILTGGRMEMVIWLIALGAVISMAVMEYA